MSTLSVASSSSSSSSPLFILYGSATGNAEHIAKDLAASYEKQLATTKDDGGDGGTGANNGGGGGGGRFSSVICCELDQFKKKCQPTWEQEPSTIMLSTTTTTATSMQQEQHQCKHGVIVVTSTTGNGDAPENAGRFVRLIKRKITTSSSGGTSSLLFRHVAYAVLALGDTNYDQFCACGVLVDKKMHEHGGQRVQSLACADEATGLEDVVEPWKATILRNMEQACFALGVQQSSLSLSSTSTSSSNNGGAATVTEDGATAPECTSSDERTTTKQKPAKAVATTTANELVTTKTTTIETSAAAASAAAAVVDNTSSIEAAPPAIPTANSSTSISTGVEIIRALMGFNNKNSNGYGDDINKMMMDDMNIDASLLPSLTASMSSCELIDNKDPEHDDVVPELQSQQRPRGGSFSTVSSSGIHYTARKPYASTILAARYLTMQTSSIAAERVVATTTTTTTISRTTATSDNSTTTASTTASELDDDQWLSWWQRAQEIYDDAFALDCRDAMSAELNGKRVVELTLSLPDDDTTLEYEPGDSLGLLVENPAESVQFILDMLQRQQQQQQQSDAPSPSSKQAPQLQQLISIDSNLPISVQQALRQEVDLSSPIKSKRILYALSQHATDAQEQCALRLLSCKAKHGEELFAKYIDEQRRTVVDILREFPSTQCIPLTALISLLPSSIPPRYYSVASSPLATSSSSSPSLLSASDNGSNTAAKGLTIAFSVVDYITPSMIVNEKEVGRRRIRGIATRYLEILASPFLWQTKAAAAAHSHGNILANAKVRIFPKPTAEFRLPTSLKKPLILIGPGTGIAPFVGFLSHRRLQIQAARDAKAKAEQTIVEGTWRSGFELDEEDNLDDHRRPAKQSQQEQQQPNSTTAVTVDKDVGPVHVFFGCRHAYHDWIYRQEMQRSESLGIVEKLYTAFSRDNDNSAAGNNNSSSNNSILRKKKYVQDFLCHDQSCASRIAHLILQEDAAVYICGDGNKMAKDVQAAMVELLLLAGGGRGGAYTNGGTDNNINNTGSNGGIPQTKDEAQEYLNKMKAEQRFLLDIWS
jgi:sulfite reductase alpha subunit-like flavoprotein